MKLDFYKNKTAWNFVLSIVACFIVLFTLWYSNQLAEDIATEEREKVKLIANTFKQINVVEDDEYRAFLLEIIINNNTVPVILTDIDDNISVHRNLSLEVDNKKYFSDREYQRKTDIKLKQILSEIKKIHPPIEIKVTEELSRFIYYDDSMLLKQLKFFPYVQLGLITLFVFVGFLVFNTSRRSEQNKVWVGMAKETAHQLGTPISSLIGWVEYFKNDTDNIDLKSVIPELEKDINRLNQIAERFSKIGAPPELLKVNIIDNLNNISTYMSKRFPKSVNFEFVFSSKEVLCYLNGPLFSWVIENIIVNALNALEGKGTIKIILSTDNKNIFVDIADTGKGIHKSKFKKIFSPGYTTRTRGWGLGLSLAKRIIEDYHTGKIFVKESTLGKGTIFRIVLNKG